MYFNSPYGSLAEALFAPSSTAQTAGSTVNQISNAADPYTHLRGAGGNGLSANLFDAVSHGGTMAGAQATAPLQQRMQDAQANAAWNLSKGQAAGQFANDAFGMLGQQGLNNQRFGRAMLSAAPGLMAGLFG